MSMKGLELRGNPDYRFKFNGKERTEVFGWNMDDFGWRNLDNILPSFTRPDPLAENNYHLTPYHALSNNPINRIDPDGKDDFDINHRGEIVNRIENKEADNFYIVNKEGKRVEGQSISFDYGTIASVKHPQVRSRNSKTGKATDKTLTIFRVNGDENATQLFEFLADPASTNVEFTYAKIGTEQSNSNIVGTSHEGASTPVAGYLNKTGYTLRESIHNHPGGSKPSQADRKNASEYEKTNRDIILKIYIHPKRYYRYNSLGVMTILPEIEINDKDE